MTRGAFIGRFIHTFLFLGTLLSIAVHYVSGGLGRGETAIVEITKWAIVTGGSFASAQSYWKRNRSS